MSVFSGLQLILGLVFFLFGMQTMSANLERLAGGRLERLLQKVANSPPAGLIAGAAVTIALQSSSAVTVMLVGLANSGVLQFSQTIYLLFGANIGATLTVWLFSLSGIACSSLWMQLLKPENFSPILALFGIVLLLAGKTERKKSAGAAFVGFAVLIYGMKLMAGAVSPLAELPGFTRLLLRFQNPLVCILTSTLFTAVIQSSAAALGMLQALTLTGCIPVSVVIPLVMGANIGTCVTSLLSSIGADANARRVAVIHILLNAVGSLILLPLYLAASLFLGLDFSAAAATPAAIALIHTVFNTAITVLLLPFSQQIIFFSEALAPNRRQSKRSRTC